MMRCDSHIHVVEPEEQAPLLAARTYTPHPAPLETVQALSRPHGIERFVVVQPSFYGTDNDVTLRALDTLGEAGRGVAVVEPNAADDAMLAALHRRGIRGLRINLYSALGAQQAQPLDQTFGPVAAMAAQMGWHVEVLAALPVLARHAALLAASPARLVLDHYGLHDDTGPNSAEGQALLGLLRRATVWMKLSAPSRSQADDLATRPDPAWLAAFLAAAPSRCVWGSDWPHTPHVTARTGPPEPTPYRGIEYAALVRDYRAAVNDAALADATMSTNPDRLYWG